MRGTEFPVATLLSVNISWEQTLGGQKKPLSMEEGHKQRVGNRERQSGYTQEEPSYDLMPPVNNLNK